MAIYEVTTHWFGRAMIKTGVMAGCYGFTNHRHEFVGRYRSLQQARDVADAQPVCAVVTEVSGYYRRLHHNGKEAGLPEGWQAVQHCLSCTEMHAVLRDGRGK